MGEVSEIFEEAFSSHSGGLIRDCACGRMHFDYNGAGAYEEGELEALLAKQEKDPALYIGHNGTVSTMTINQEEIVYDCPCSIAERFENILIKNAESIVTYLRLRAKALREKADRIDPSK